ncbi:MAG: glucosaminidase domain-containing protein [Bacteroidota bacterium]
MSRSQILLAFLAIPSFFSFNKSEIAIHEYINTYKFIAQQEMNRTGIPASITLAQGILESGSGKSTLAQKSNNHFGVKCKNDWEGKKAYHEDDDYHNGKLIKSCFRAYATPFDSYRDHSAFLQENQRYAFLFELEPLDYKAWAKGLKQAGYATAPDYAEKLIALIEKFELYQYDRGDLIIAKFEKDPVPPRTVDIREAPTFEIVLTETPLENFETETLVAEAPPQAILIPENYQVGDGLRKQQSVTVTRSFDEVVYGNSSRYLDEISPRK